MSQYLDQRYETWIGRTLTDPAGHKLGRVEDIYTDDRTGEPEWLAVSTGLVRSLVFVPVAGAVLGAESDLQSRFHKEQVKDAPKAGRGGKLTPDEIVRLAAHYGVPQRQQQARPPRRPAHDRAPLPVAFEQEPRRTESPLDWNHDDRIDSIRPPAHRSHSLR